MSTTEGGTMANTSDTLYVQVRTDGTRSEPNCYSAIARLVSITGGTIEKHTEPEPDDAGTYDALMEHAYRLGAEAGEAAASWYFDGNTTQATYAAVLRGLDEGDPAIYDTFATAPLSGEWAGDPTPTSVLEEIGLTDSDDAADDALRMYEDGFGVAYADAVEAEARRMVEPDDEPDTTVRDLAQLMSRRFTRRTREDGTTYTTLTDAADEWMTDVVRDAHDGMLPDDWRFDAIAAAVEFLADNEDAGDRVDEWADGMIDTDMRALVDWLGSHVSRWAYCDEARAEWGGSAEYLSEDVMRGQYLEALEVFGFVVRALEERC